MSYTTLSNWGPVVTPTTIRRLIIFTAIATLLSAAIQTIFNQFGLAPGPQELLSLSWQGLSRGYVWQPLTYLFIQASSTAGITFFYLLSLSFNMYMLWVLGTALIGLVGTAPFLRLYFIGGSVAGLIALPVMKLSGNYSLLAGNSAALLALLTAWSMAFAEAEVRLFFLIPVKVKWLVAGIIAVLTLTTFSQWDLADLALYLSAILFGYAYAAIAWGWRSPFPRMQRLDHWLTTLDMRYGSYLPGRSKKGNKAANNAAKASIIDIETGQTTESDNAFVDVMLAKISTHGESALSWSERRRLQQISERKLKDKNKR